MLTERINSELYISTVYNNHLSMNKSKQQTTNSLPSSISERISTSWPLDRVVFSSPHGPVDSGAPGPSSAFCVDIFAGRCLLSDCFLSSPSCHTFTTKSVLSTSQLKTGAKMARSHGQDVKEAAYAGVVGL